MLRTLAVVLVLGTVMFAGASSAVAGCGCDKPPPPVAPIRPAFASPGSMVTLFASDLVAGAPYAVTFTNGTTSATVPGTALTRRDFADGVAKLQVVAPVPPLPMGPTSVTLKSGLATLATVAATDFTVLQRAVALTEDNGGTTFTCYRGAVAADGTLYLALNIAAIARHTVFSGVGLGLPLMFSSSDIAIYNTQGVLMQLLGSNNAAIWAIKDENGTESSFTLNYDRHEFLTYREEHVHEGSRLLDPEDPAWHLDGTRHIDHDNLVIAIRGKTRSGAALTPGMTKSFNLEITTGVDGAYGRVVRDVDLCTSR